MKLKPVQVFGLPVQKFFPGIGWFIFVLIIICLPGSDIPPVEDWLAAVYFDKWVHAGLFFVLCFLFMYPVARLSITKKTKLNYLLKIALAACTWGITTEFIQKFFIPDRDFDLFDWLADSVGAWAACGWCFFRYINQKLL